MHVLTAGSPNGISCLEYGPPPFELYKMNSVGLTQNVMVLKDKIMEASPPSAADSKPDLYF